MATLIDSAEFTSNEVYQIQATDPVEGAASGASFNGTGISNQPHQQLANRTAFLYGRQNTNIANIATLQAFTALFTGSMGQNGYLKIGVSDINRGLIQYVAQWGLVTWDPTEDEGIRGPYSFPIAFPNACEIFMPVTLTPEGPSNNADGDGVAMVSAAYPPTTSQFWIWSNAIGAANGKSSGAYWFAIGF
jgi:hypothetical protein